MFATLIVVLHVLPAVLGMRTNQHRRSRLNWRSVFPDVVNESSCRTLPVEASDACGHRCSDCGCYCLNFSKVCVEDLFEDVAGNCLCGRCEGSFEKFVGSETSPIPGLGEKSHECDGSG